jgi:hypothetical protein
MPKHTLRMFSSLGSVPLFRRQLVYQLGPLAFNHGSHFVRDVVDACGADTQQASKDTGLIMRGGQLPSPEHPTKAAVSVDALIRSRLMKLPFSRRNAELENMNRILTDAARKKAERIKEVEDQVAQLEHQVGHLKQALESARKRESELEVAATQRAHLLNEKDKEIAALREVLAQRAHLLNDKDEELAGLWPAPGLDDTRLS